MPLTDYEHFRERLERQLRADVELIFEAYQTKLRAFETVARARGELEEGSGSPPLARPALELGPAPAPPALAWPAAPTAAPAPPPRRRSHAYEVHDAVERALAQVGEVFDRHDLCRVLGYVPSRATLHRVLGELQETGAIAVEEIGLGRRPARYRQRTFAPAVGNAEPAG